MEDPSSSRIHIQPTVVSNLLTRKSALERRFSKGTEDRVDRIVHHAPEPMSAVELG